MDYLKRSWAEIHLDRLDENIGNFKALLAPQNQLLCVVKASCYGHSDFGICPHLQNDLGVKWFAVSNEEEGIRLRKMGITGEILILGYTPPEAAPLLARFNIIQAVTEYSYAYKLSQFSGGNTIRCHIAIDTGMTRIGLRGTPQHICEEFEKISRLDRISAEGIFTHYAAADSDDPSDIEYTNAQTEQFFEVKRLIEERGLTLSQAHCLNSAGGIYHTDSRSTLARLGIVLYGLMPNPDYPLPFKAKPVMDMKAVVAQVKTIEPDTYVSYGRTYRSEKPVKLATITCGYADGYPRALSNKGWVLIHGKRAPITGRVCMDQFMCDVTDIDGVCAGDVATLIGTDGGETITADDIARLTGTIGYEIVCGISSRVPRVIYNNGKQLGVF
ncbi:MAG: alanine racemase [Oscillospiraceae bacterium]